MPVLFNPPAGVTVNVAVGRLTVSAAALVVFPFPFVVFVNVIVSLNVPAARLFALALIEIFIVSFVPAVIAPLVLFMSIHAAVFAAVQLMFVVPVFVKV